jgi:CheY-like chemotaxis protein
MLLQLRPDIRLLAMSGLSRGETDGSDIQAVQKLAHAFLLKPFQPEDLLGAVHHLLHSSRKP